MTDTATASTYAGAWGVVERVDVAGFPTFTLTFDDDVTTEDYPRREVAEDEAARRNARGVTGTDVVAQQDADAALAIRRAL